MRGSDQLRDCIGISELPLIQLISPYKISCIRVSLEIPLLSLAYLSTPDMQFHFTTEEEELLTPVCMQ